MNYTRESMRSLTLADAEYLRINIRKKIRIKCAKPTLERRMHRVRHGFMRPIIVATHRAAVAVPLPGKPAG